LADFKTHSKNDLNYSTVKIVSTDFYNFGKICMKTLIIGAGPLGSLYACLLHQAGKDVTILARNEHYKFLQENGVVLINEFTSEKIVERVKVVDRVSNMSSTMLIMKKQMENDCR
jgi:ketopantoate reductase